jgi:hypothetical protein
LSGKTQVDIALLKIRQRGKANAVAQFFKIIGGIPSGPAPLFEPNAMLTIAQWNYFTFRLRKFLKPGLT